MNLPVNGFSMAYTDIGQGTPLVLVHGYPLNRQIWSAQAEALKDRARVLAPDMRGHGDSQPVAGPYSMQLLAGDLAAFLQQLKIQEPIILGGLSMGGYIAFSFLHHYPQRVKALILTATRAAPDHEQAKAGRDQAAQIALQKGVSEIAHGMLPKLFAPQTLSTRPDLVERVRKIMEATSLQGVLGDLVAMKERRDARPDLPEIRLPTLIIHGAEDSIIPLQEAQSMQQSIPGASLEVVQGAGHLPNMEQEDRFNQVVRNFINQHQL